MGSKIQCFFLESTNRAEIGLRRFTFSAKGSCLGPMSYHNAQTTIGQCDFKPPSGEPDLIGYGGKTDHGDPRWPTACPCGHKFGDDDQWQTRVNRLYRRSDGGGETTIDGAPPGAMWYADWWPDKGPDGHCLAVKTPAGIWMIDGPSSTDGKGWARTGTPPKITANPSIGVGKMDRKGWAYHGWLRDGFLVEC